MFALIARIVTSMALLAGAIGGAVLILSPEAVVETVAAVLVGVGVVAVLDWALFCTRYAAKLRRVNAAI